MATDEEDHCFLVTHLLLLVISFATCLRSATASASPSDHRFGVGDPIPIFVNKIGPLNNPSETYWYYDLPFCLPDQILRKKESLGEVLNGDRLANALYQLNFREDKDSEVICKKRLSREEVLIFRNAVKKDYYYQMYYDNLPIWGFIGKVDDTMMTSNETGLRYYLFKHIQFNVHYNQDQVVQITAFSDPNNSVDIMEDIETDVEFLYSVHWLVSPVGFQNRMDRYLHTALLPQHQRVHWFSIFNSVVIILLLVGFLATLLFGTLKNDLNKYSPEIQLEDEEEAGWKYIRADVFRYPPHRPLLCAILGTGTQLLILILIIFILAFMGIFYPYNHGAMRTSLVVIYSITSFVAGYISSSFHTQWGGVTPIKSMLLTGFILPGPCLLIICILNTIAIFYGATAALPFGTIFLVLLIWLLVTFPLLFLGHIFGRTIATEFQPPCPTRRIPTDIPLLAWYRRILPHWFLAGFLPFCSVLMEFRFLLKSLWGHKIYTTYSTLFITFIALVIVTVFLSITLTYLQLAAEDHKWWWRSVLYGGSTSLFIYGYCCYFYVRSPMSGLLQFSSFFGYSACMCYTFFLLLGTVSFYTSLLFVRHIYHAIKSE